METTFLFTNPCFAQVSKLSDSWRDATIAKRSGQRGGFGGVSSLEKKRQYRSMADQGRKDSYGMVFDKHEMRHRNSGQDRRDYDHLERSRSRSPRRREYHRDDRRDRHYEGKGRDDRVRYDSKDEYRRRERQRR